MKSWKEILVKAVLILGTVFLAGETGTMQAIAEEQQEYQKADKNGYDILTNRSYTFGGMKFEVPAYYGEPSTTEDQNTFFYAEGGGDTLAFLQFVALPLSCTLEEYEDIKAQQIQPVLDAYNGDTPSFLVTDSGTAGFPGRQVYFDYVDSSGLPMNASVFYVYNNASESVVYAIAGQSENSRYDYFGDFIDMINDIELDRSSLQVSPDEVTPEFKAKMDACIQICDEYAYYLENKNYINYSDANDYILNLSLAEAELRGTDLDTLTPADRAYFELVFEYLGRLQSQESIDTAEDVMTDIFDLLF